MSASGKITISGLPRAELEAMAERLQAENAALTRAVAELRAEAAALLRAEVAALEGLKGRPEVRPSGMEKATEPGTGRGRGAKGSKSARLTVHEECSPGPYLELFARRARPGWHAWGDEIPMEAAAG